MPIFIVSYLASKFLSNFRLPSCDASSCGRRGRRSSWRWFRIWRKCWKQKGRGRWCPRVEGGQWGQDASGLARAVPEKLEVLGFQFSWMMRRRWVFWATKIVPNLRAEASFEEQNFEEKQLKKSRTWVEDLTDLENCLNCLLLGAVFQLLVLPLWGLIFLECHRCCSQHFAHVCSNE